MLSRPSRAAFSALVDLLWPPVCPVCERELLEGGNWVHDRGPTRQALVHADCLEPLRSPPRSPVVPAPWSEGVPLTWSFPDTPAWFRLLHAIKYGGRWPLLDLLAAVASLPCPVAWERRRPAVLVPLPDDRRRRRERGESVTGRLARRWAERWGCDLRPQLLRRRAERPAQARLVSIDARKQNVRGLFGPGELASVPRGRPLILVEDQVTTGCTVRAAARELGARGHPLAVVALAAASKAPRRVSP